MDLTFHLYWYLPLADVRLTCHHSRAPFASSLICESYVFGRYTTAVYDGLSQRNNRSSKRKQCLAYRCIFAAQILLSSTLSPERKGGGKGKMDLNPCYCAHSDGGQKSRRHQPLQAPMLSYERGYRWTEPLTVS